MIFKHTHEHLKNEDYCWAIVTGSQFPEAELVKIRYDSCDEKWYVDNDEIPINLYVFGDKIEQPSIYEIDGEEWKVNRRPFTPTKL